MSIDFNSIINSAFDAADRKKAVAAGVVDSVFNPNGVAQAGSGGLSELSIEDIAGAMKNRGAKKSEENKFVERHTASTFVRKEERKEDNVIAGNVQDKISAIQASAAQAVSRQNQVADNIRQSRVDPFAR